MSILTLAEDLAHRFPASGNRPLSTLLSLHQCKGALCWSAWPYRVIRACFSLRLQGSQYSGRGIGVSSLKSYGWKLSHAY